MYKGPKARSSLGLWRTEVHLSGWRAEGLGDLGLHHKGGRCLWRVGSRPGGSRCRGQRRWQDSRLSELALAQQLGQSMC